MQAPLNDEIESLRLQVKDKSKRIIELENDIDMVKQDRTHIEQKFNNLRLELEMVRQLASSCPIVVRTEGCGDSLLMLYSALFC